MEEKKINDRLNEHHQREESDVSCNSCPIDSVIQKLFSLFRHKN